MPAQAEEEITTLESRRAIAAYLEVHKVKGPGPGRRRGRDTVEQQLDEAKARLEAAETGFDKLIATKDVMALEAELTEMDAVDNKRTLELEFIRTASVYAKSKNIPRAAFRAVGVSPRVLSEAGI